MADLASHVPPEVKMAIGRIFLMGSRPEQPGDAKVYADCRAVIMDASGPAEDRSLSFARDYGRGAAGQW